MPSGVYARPSLAERFWARVCMDGPLPQADAVAVHPEIAGTACWSWQGPPNHNGYGQMSVGPRGPAHAVKIVTHVAWFLETGEWPAFECILHKCDNPACVRFLHLLQGTRPENMADMGAKGRRRSWGWGVTR